MSHRYIILHHWLETDLGDVGAGKGESIGEVQKGPRVEVGWGGPGSQPGVGEQGLITLRAGVEEATRFRRATGIVLLESHLTRQHLALSPTPCCKDAQTESTQFPAPPRADLSPSPS